MSRTNKTFDTAALGPRMPSAARGPGARVIPRLSRRSADGRDATWYRGARFDSLISSVYPRISTGAGPGPAGRAVGSRRRPELGGLWTDSVADSNRRQFEELRTRRRKVSDAD